jgi:ribonuclease HI
MSNITDKKVFLFTDGSFNEPRNQASYGFVVVNKNGDKSESEFECSGVVGDHQGSRNVAGELFAVIEGLRHLVGKASEVVICHDYSGVREWVSGSWKAKKKLTQDYRAEMANLAKKFKKLSFVHVKGHSGNFWNDYADKLAGSAFEDSSDEEQLELPI